jgi:hypothetical protein
MKVGSGYLYSKPITPNFVAKIEPLAMRSTTIPCVIIVLVLEDPFMKV